MVEDLTQRAAGSRAAQLVRAAAARQFASALERRARRTGFHQVLYRQTALGLRREALMREMSAADF